MPINEMQKVYVLAHRDLRGKLLSFLQKKELIEIKSIKEKVPAELLSKASLPDIDYDLNLAELNFAIHLLSKIKEEKKNFIDSFVPAKPIVKDEEVTSCFAEFAFKEVIEKCRTIDSELANLKGLEDRLNLVHQELTPWQNIGVKLNELVDKENIRIVIGKFPSNNYDAAIAELEEASKMVHVERLCEQKKCTLVCIVYLKEEAQAIEELLKKNSFDKIALPLSDLTPNEEIKDVLRLKKKMEEDKKGFMDELLSLEKYKMKLMLAHDCLLSKKAAKEATDASAETNNLFLISGWIRKKDRKSLEQDLKHISSEIVVYDTEPDPDEVVPVDIENSAFIRPFETVTKIYGLPKYGEIDPTPILALFFIVFFALCFGDAGYGVMLLLICWFFLSKPTLPFSTRNLFRLLTYGGVVSIIVGAMTGSWFGIDLSALPSSMALVTKPLLKIKIFDPIKDPLGMLVVSLILGVIHIFVGMFVMLYMKLRDKRYLEAVIDDVFWIYFLIGLLLYGATAAGIIPKYGFIPYIPLSGAVLLVLTQGRSKPNIIMKFFSGVLSLYRIPSYVGDVLSYARLLALGLSTAVLAMVINMIAFMAKDSLPILGYVIMFLILLFGHSFNLIINILGSFIHSGRLQYVEFFGKFLEGGGRAFKPLRRETKYIVIK